MRIAVVGVCASGKTTLILESLIPALEAQIGRASLPPHRQARRAGGGTLGRLTGMIDAAGNRQSIGWDRWGNRVMITGRDGGRTINQYDGRGRLSMRVEETGARLSYDYDDAERVQGVRQVAESLGVSDAYAVAIVASGAFFGDNLSFISDTTIAATRTQGCGMRDKFRVNFIIVFPAALIALGIYFVRGLDLPATPREMTQPAWLMIPYLLVLISAVGGLNVLLVLVIGIISSGLLVFALDDVTMWDWTQALGEGIGGMGELITVTLLAGGMLELIRYNGGED